jgi:protocatechuate 3,4-dioxygenase beta subunit
VRVTVGEVGHALLRYAAPDEIGFASQDAGPWSATLETDDAGRFSADGLAPGEYTLIASDPAGTTRGLAFTSVKLRPGEPRDLRLALRPPAYVVGAVSGLDLDPNLVALDLVPRHGIANVVFRPRFDRLERDAGGWSLRSVALPPLIEWDLVATRRDVLSTTLLRSPVDAHPGEETKIALALDSGASLRGRVVDESGNAVPGVSVVATSNKEPETERGTSTDLQGRYELRGLRPGTWRLDAKRCSMRKTETPGAIVEAPVLDVSGRRSVLITDAVEYEADVNVAAFKAPSVGEPAPEFEVLLLDGRTLALSQLRGRPVLLFGWASFDPLSRAELGRFAASYSAWSERGLEIVGIALDEEPGLVRRIVASRAPPWPQAAPGPIEANPIAKLHGLVTVPSTVLIGSDGRIAALLLTGDSLDRAIEGLLERR